MGLAQSIGALFSRFGRRSSPSPEAGENEAHRLGREGERLALGYLRRQGYKVLYRNFRAPHGGEVDIVCRDKTCGMLVFIEVKTRRSLAFGTPAEAVTRTKQKLIIRGAQTWLRMLDDPGILYRFDVVEIVIGATAPQFNLIRDAFKFSEPA